jgi:hypothetical protein
MAGNKRQLHLWLSESDFGQLKALANEAGEGIGTLSRRVLRAYLRRRTESSTGADRQLLIKPRKNEL